VIKFVFWVCVLAGVFILGLGYGRTLSGESDRVNQRVTIAGQKRTIEGSAPAKTVTVTKTIRAPAAAARK
jgi:hypothetical protein